MTPHLSALGFTLIHFCWQAALIAGLYKLVEVSAPGLRSPERYLMGLVAMVAMLVMAIGTFVYEDIRLASEPALVAIAPASGAAAHGNLTMEGLLPWLDGAWLLGVAALSVRMLGGLWFLQRLTSAAEAVPETVARRFAVLMQRAGVKNVAIRLHARIDGPFVIGALRSVVYLPVSAVTALSPDQLDAVLAHELEHVRRADYVWNLVQSAIETLFFFHPAVWWLGARLREQRELCCDDAAVTLCQDPLTYATALLNLEEQRRARTGRDMGLAMALNGQGSGKTLVSRIARVLGERSEPRTKGRPPAVYAVPAVLLILAAFVAPGAQVAAQQAKALAIGEESAAAVMDDATASSVSNSVHTPDIVLRTKGACPRRRAAAICDKVKPDVDLAWSWVRDDADRSKDKAWKAEKDAWAKQKATWTKDKDNWDDQRALSDADWQGQVEALSRAGLLSEHDRQRVEQDARNAARDALNERDVQRIERDARNSALSDLRAATDQQSVARIALLKAVDDLRDDTDRLRIPAAPLAPMAPVAPRAMKAVPAPPAAPAPLAAPAARPAPAAAPTPPSPVHAAPVPPRAPAPAAAPRAPQAPVVKYDQTAYTYSANTYAKVDYRPVVAVKTVSITAPAVGLATAVSTDTDTTTTVTTSPFVIHVGVKTPGHIAPRTSRD